VCTTYRSGSVTLSSRVTFMQSGIMLQAVTREGRAVRYAAIKLLVAWQRSGPLCVSFKRECGRESKVCFKNLLLSSKCKACANFTYNF
jgi:hypothetical protein